MRARVGLAVAVVALSVAIGGAIWLVSREAVERAPQPSRPVEAAAQSDATSEDTDEAPPETTTPDASVAHGGAIQGRVLLGGVGAPARIAATWGELDERAAWDEDSWAERQLASPAQEFVTETRDGAFEITEVPPGRYTVRAVDGSARDAEGTAVVWAVGTSAALTLTLREGVPRSLVRGRIVNAPEGLAFDHALLSSFPYGNEFGARRTVTAAVDEQRCFEAELPAHPYGRVELLTEGVLRIGTFEFDPRSDDEIVVDLAEAFAPLEVRVVAESDDAPIEGAAAVVTSTWAERRVFSSGHTDAAGVARVQVGRSALSVAVTAPGFPALKDMRVAEHTTEVLVTLRRGTAVRARVIAPDGTPLAGVPVHVGRYAESSIWPGPPPVTTDDTGVALVEGLLPGPVVVYAAGLGWFSKGLELGAIVGDGFTVNARRPLLVPRPLRANEVLDVTLSAIAAARVEGRVLRADGSPAAGAVVRAVPGDRAPHLGWEIFEAPAVSVAVDGTFTLDGLHPSLGYRVVAEEPGTEASASETIPPTTGVAVVNLRLSGPDDGCAIDVTVLDDATGEPLPDASVSVRRPRRDGGRPSRGVTGSGVTGATGTVRIGHLDAEDCEVIASAPDRVTSEAMTVGKAAVLSGGAAVTLRLGRGRTISGRAVLPSGDVPRAGVAFAANSENVDSRRAGSWWSRPPTGEALASDGTFQLTAMGPDSDRARVVGERGGERFAGEVTLASGDDAVVVELRALPAEPRWQEDTPELQSLPVRVVDPDGRPVDSASIYIRWTHEGMTQGTSFAVVSGEAAVPLTARGGTVTISRARSLNGMPLDLGTLQTRLPVDAQEGYAFRLPEGLTVTGRVLDDQGVGVPGARIDVLVAGEESGAQGDRFGPFGPTVVAFTVSDTDGGFELRGLAADAWDVRVEPPLDYERPATVRVAAGDDGVAIALSLGMRPVITVVDEDGEPVAGALVTVKEGIGFGSEFQFGQTTDAAGHARLPAVPRAKQCWLEVSAWGTDMLAHHEQWTTAPEQVVRLTRARSVRGRVETPDGVRVPGITIWYRQADSLWGWQPATADARGEFEIARLERGDVRVCAGDYASSAMGFRGTSASVDDAEAVAEHAVTVQPGSTDIVLRPDMSRTARVRFGGVRVEELQPPPELRTRRWGSDHVGRLLPGADHLLFTGLGPEQEYSLEGRYPKLGLVMPATVVRAGEQHDVTPTRGVDLVGRFAVPAGARIEKITVRFETAHDSIETEAAADGTFTIPCLSAVEGRLSAYSYNVGPNYSGGGKATPGVRFEGELQQR